MSEPNSTLVVPQKPARPFVKAGDRGLVLGDMDQMARFCEAVVNSHAFKGIDSPHLALIMVQAGAELGLTPIWSLANIMVVNGRPSVWGDAFLGILMAHPDFEDIIETEEGMFPNDDYTSVCTLKRRGRHPVTRRFSIKDAKIAGLWQKRGKDGSPTPWVTFPKRMMQMRVRSWAGRDGFADALRGLGVVEEQRDISPVYAHEVKEEEGAAKPKVIFPDEISSETPSDAVGDQQTVDETGDGGGGNKEEQAEPTTSSETAVTDTPTGEKKNEKGEFIWDV